MILICILVTAEAVKVGFVEVKFTSTKHFQGGKKRHLFIVIVWGCLFNTNLLSAVTESFVRVQKQRTKPQSKLELNAYCDGEYSRKMPNK